MNWRDFFYFSKGERRALIVLLCLIVIAWIALIVTNQRSSVVSNQEQLASYPICIYSFDNSHFSLLEGDEKGEKSTEKDSSSLKKEEVATKKIEPSQKKNSFSPPTYKTEKYPKGTIVELNTADTTILKKVPGIGTAFSNRIIKYRNLLGGFYCVEQLAEVYGIDEERYETLKEWFCVNPHLVKQYNVNRLSIESLAKHPYISWKQASVMKQLCKQKGRLSGWENLRLLEEFTETDIERISPYLSFE